MGRAFPVNGNGRWNNNSFPRKFWFFCISEDVKPVCHTLLDRMKGKREALQIEKWHSVCARLSLSKKCLLQKCMLYLSGFDISKEDLAGLVLLLCVNLQFSWQRNFNFKRMGKWVYDNSTSKQALQCVVRNKLIKTWIWAPSFCQV